jgi:hypothetical protein
MNYVIAYNLVDSLSGKEILFHKLTSFYHEQRLNGNEDAFLFFIDPESSQTLTDFLRDLCKIHNFKVVTIDTDEGQLEDIGYIVESWVENSFQNSVPFLIDEECPYHSSFIRWSGIISSDEYSCKLGFEEINDAFINSLPFPYCKSGCLWAEFFSNLVDRTENVWKASQDYALQLLNMSLLVNALDCIQQGYSECISELISESFGDVYYEFDSVIDKSYVGYTISNLISLEKVKDLFPEELDYDNEIFINNLYFKFFNLNKDKLIDKLLLLFGSYENLMFSLWRISNPDFEYSIKVDYNRLSIEVRARIGREFINFYEFLLME